MPFTVTRPKPVGKLYIQRQPDGELFWTPSKDKATRLDEAEADAIKAGIDRYGSVEITVEGIAP